MWQDVPAVILEHSSGTREGPRKSEKGCCIYNMNYGEIKKCDIANGEGVRVSLFVSGCRHHCPGCFNQATWDFSYGKEFTRETEKQILEFLERIILTVLRFLEENPLNRKTRRSLQNFSER